TLAIDNVLDLPRKTAMGKSGEFLQLLDLKPNGNGEFHAVVRWRVNLPLGRNKQLLPDLLDAQGQKYHGVSIISRVPSLITGENLEAMIVYRAKDKVGLPARLVYVHSRTRNIEIPFSFNDVSLE